MSPPSKPAPGATKKHLARVERERIQRNWIVGGTLATALLVIGLLSYGWVDQNVLRPRRPVAVVNGEAIPARSLEARFLLAQNSLLAQYRQTQQIMSFFGSDPTYSASFQQQLSQIQAQLNDVEGLRQSVLNQMVDEHLIRQEANRRGIFVSAAEVQTSVEEAFNYFAHGTPTPAPTLTPGPTFTASPTATATLTPTAGPSPTASPSAVPTEGPSPSPSPSPTNTPTETATATATATVTAGPSPTITATPTASPTATPYTQQAFNTDYQTYVANLAKAGISESDFRSQFEAQLYRQRLLKAFEASVPRDQEQVHARHILVADETAAKAIIASLQAGGDWNKLAAERSLDTSNKDQGGDLGWFGRGAMVKPFEDAAFSAAIGQTVGPIQSQFGWHVIQVLARETRRLDDTAYQQAVQQAFTTWLDAQRTSTGVTIEKNWSTLLPAATPPTP